MKDKVILITGASQGLGKELSLQTAALGAKVALIARSENLLKELQKTIISQGGVAQYFVCDVTNYDQVKKTVSAVYDHFGTIDILVNNAGIYTTDVLEETKPDIISHAFEVNSVGPIYFIKSVLPHMKQSNYGHIFNVISDAGLDLPGNKDWPTYTATKWAMTGYTKALQHQLLGTKIKVTGFYPNAFESNIFETAQEPDAHNQPWMMRTADVAAAIVYALSRPDDLFINTISMSNI